MSLGAVLPSRRAAAVSVGALLVAAAWLLFRSRRKRQGDEETSERAATMGGARRGGRRNYRAEAKKTQQRAAATSPPPDERLTPMCWSEEVERVTQPQTAAACSSVKLQADSYKLVESPSLTSDLRSEASLDSGRGESTGVASTGSPVDELMNGIELMPMYEFEIPQTLVGLIIGIKGKTIKDLCDRSNTKMFIRRHHLRDDIQICTVEGHREDINRCLRMLRRRFPPSRFPELNLKPVLPPPIQSPVPLSEGQIAPLSLPEGVACEVVLSSVQDAGHFFLQQPTHSTFASLSRLDQYMMVIYSQTTGVPPLPSPVEVGVLCAAPALGGFFRAMTVAYYEETDEAVVKFVDYGGYSRLPATDLRQIRSDFTTLPLQAVECYLANVRPHEETEGWSADASAWLQQLASNGVMEAVVSGYATDGAPLVDLVAAVDGQRVDVATAMVGMDFARWSNDERAASPAADSPTATIASTVN